MEDPTDWHHYAAFFAGLFAMTNVIGNTPVFLNLTERFSRAEQQRCALAATATAFAMLATFAVLGDLVLNLFSITVADMRIAGGLIILSFGLHMVGAFGGDRPAGTSASSSPVAVGVSPLGMPLAAGPGAISLVIVFAQLKETVEHSVVLLAMIAACCATLFLAFQAAIFAGKWIHGTAATVINRTMGLILASIAVSLLTAGIKQAFGS